MTNNQLSIKALSLGLGLALFVPQAGRAQIDPRSIGPVLLAAGGPTGPYFERFGLRYYREAYPGTECDYLFGRELGPACAVMGDYTIDQVYFPDPNKVWI